MSTEGISQGGREAELLRHAHDVVVELRSDGRIAYISPAVERVLGRPPDYYTNLSFLEVVLPEDRLPSLAHFRKVVDTRDEALLRFRVVHRDGHHVEFEATARSFVDHKEQLRVVAVCRDLTEQARQRALDGARDAHHRAIAESATRPAVIVAVDGQIQFSNRRFRELFGTRESIHDLRERMNEENRASMDAAWFETSQEEGAKTGHSDFEFSNCDGTTSWYSATWEAVQSVDSNLQFAVLYQDITRRKKIERALRFIAQGLSDPGIEPFQSIVAMTAEALEMDRLVLGVIPNSESKSEPDRLDVLVAWQDNAFLTDEHLLLDGLPDRDVANGEVCIHPTAIGQLMPDVTEKIGHDFESYAGLPLFQTDGSVLGIVGGYSRKPIHDTDLVRSVLTSFAMLVAAAIDRRRADEEVLANRARFDALADQAQDMLVEIDSKSRVTYMSPASRTVLGREPSSFIGRSVQELTHPDDRAITERSFGQIAAGQRHTPAVTRGRHTDGTWRWIESRASSFKAIDGSARTLIVARDVTERRRIELGRDLLFSVLQHGADLVFVCEGDTTLLFANEPARHLLGASEDGEIERQRFTELLSEDDAERLEAEVLPNLTPATPWSGELVLRGAATHESSPVAIAAEATVFLFQGSDGSAETYLAITLRDISERRRAEEALRQSELRLNQAQKMEAVGRLAGGIAHDFNNLLTAIIGYSDLVLDQLGTGHGSTRDVEEILRAAERAGGLTRQLLAFSRRQVLQPESVDLNAVVADIDRMMRRLIGENIELVTVQDGELHSIVADPGQIEQVIVNLVVNARDAMPRGGRIEIETLNFSSPLPFATDSGKLEAGDYVLLRVSDTGIGMDESVRAQIFEPFFTTKEPHEGTGLGLASAYGIVSQTGGQIDVDSAPGEGTTFSVYLPAATARTQALPEEGDNLETRGNETILVVEDSEPVRTLVARTLKNAGYTVLIAESATAALRHCSRHPEPIDLLLTDVVLPKTSGPEVARRALEMRPSIRTLFMSGFTDDTLIRHGLRPGEQPLLEKPFSPATALARVRLMLDAEAESDGMFHGEHSE